MICGFGFLKLRLGGSILFSSASTVLINPATPAADARCPTLLFTDPSAQKLFLLVFALNACGLIIGAQISGKLTERVGTSRLLTCGLATMVVGGALLFTVVSTEIVGLAGVIPSLWIVMFGFGFVGPNAAALAMQRYPQAAGSAAAVLGSFQFGMAAFIAPLAGAGGTHDATPMISLILGLSALAVLSRFLLAGSARRQTAREAQDAAVQDAAAPAAVRGQ